LFVIDFYRTFVPNLYRNLNSGEMELVTTYRYL